MKFAIYIPNFGEFADPRRMSELAAVAERSGWDGFFVWDHILVASGTVVGDPWIQLAAVADATSEMRIGTMVTPLPRRRPWVVARQAVSLDQLSDGRFVLGVGIGFPPRAEFGMFGEPIDARVRGDMLDEALDIIVGLWSGEEYAHDGEHYQLAPMTFRPTPVQQPRIPIWVAGTWPHRRPFRRAARFEGVFPLKDDGGDIGMLSAEDWGEVLGFVSDQRPDGGPFAVSGVYAGGGHEELAMLESAGVDWVHIGSEPGSSYDDFLMWIGKGPPA